MLFLMLFLSFQPSRAEDLNTVLGEYGIKYIDKAVTIKKNQKLEGEKKFKHLITIFSKGYEISLEIIHPIEADLSKVLLQRKYTNLNKLYEPQKTPYRGEIT